MIRTSHRSQLRGIPLANGFHLGEAPGGSKGPLRFPEMYGCETLTALADLINTAPANLATWSSKFTDTTVAT